MGMPQDLLVLSACLHVYIKAADVCEMEKLLLELFKKWCFVSALNLEKYFRSEK